MPSVRRLLTICLLAVTPVALLAVPAQAANQTVVVGHEEFVPPRVAVKPGESVTWDHTIGHDHDQHNVTFEDGSYREPNPPQGPGWVRTRTFAANTPAGAYPYYCEVHGAPGGVGMSGVVYVNPAGSVPPEANLTSSPSSVAVTGQQVSFSAATSHDPEGAIKSFEWDLDGNGTYETNTGTTATVSRTYASPGTMTIRLRVTDAADLTDETTLPLKVTAPPTAAFTAGPNPATPGQIVGFNASGSGDTDGTVSNYSWDLDGDGTFETDTGTTATVSRAYMTPTTLNVGLRVTDNDGATAVTTRSLTVSAPLASRPTLPPAQPQQPAQQPASQPPGCGALNGSARARCMQRECRTVSRRRRPACIQRSCRYVKRGSKRAACVRKSCRTLSGRKKLACMRKSCRTLKGAKKRACARKYSSRRD